MNRVYIYIICIFVLFSCVPQKKLLYLKNKSSDTFEIAIDSLYNYKIQPGDILNIDIYSTSSSSTEIFNKELEVVKGTMTNDAGLFLKGYVVDLQGNIEIPLLGKIKVKDLSTEEISNLVEEKLKEYITFATVETKLTSFRVTIIGEVNKPGTSTIYYKGINIFQALGLAGDMTDYANRKKVKVIRKTTSGSEIETLDLSDANIINSKYFYLAPNDVIYVEPLKAKAVRINTAPTQIAISVITLLLVILNTFNNKN